MSNRMAVIFRLICVRHGETAANKEMRIQGHLDIPLSDIGEAQAKQAGIYLNPIHFTKAYTSDLSRAKTTCDNIIKENRMPVEVKMDPRIRERNFGSVEGLLFKEVLEMAKAAGASWPNYDPPGAESITDLQQRFVQFFKELCQSAYDRSSNQNKLLKEDILDEELMNVEPSEKILVVSHGAGLRQLYNHFKKILQCEDFPADADTLSKISPNTGISEFIIKYSPRRYRMKCVRLHDATHLEHLNQ